MDILLQQLVNGLVVGSIYALIALGYTMVYGILGLINFAHGEVVMIGAMVTISCLNLLLGLDTGLPGPLLVVASLLLAVPLCAALGFTIERVAYRPLRSAPRLAPLITAIGVSIVLQNLAMIIWGRHYTPFPPILTETPFHIAGVTFTSLHLTIVLTAAAIMTGLLVLVNRTRLGRAMRATAQNPAVARLMGVNVDQVIGLTFVIGSVLAAVAGVMVSANYGQAHAYMGFLIGLKAFSAAVLGGIGNLTGAMVGGLLLGVIESLGAGFIGVHTDLCRYDWLAPQIAACQTEGHFVLMGSNYQDVFAFLVLVLVLIFRPSGIMGERVAERP